MNSGRKTIVTVALGLLILAGMMSVWRMRQAGLVLLESRPTAVMGTDTVLKVVVPADETEKGQQALDMAEEVLRLVDSTMSVWVGTTEIAQFNAAPAATSMPLSGGVMNILRQSRELFDKSGGAFDVTCVPLLDLWKRAEKEDREPAPEEIAAARDLCGWRGIVLQEKGAEKTAGEAGFDFGGIAKGYAVERAVDTMRFLGVRGGLVQCGGDLQVFGETEHGGPWQVAIRDPFAGRTNTLPETLSLTDTAVSTSGNYERFFTVQGKKRSHIVDPRSGLPVDNVPQVTVIAPTADVSDGWSTTLSVLGPDGLLLLPDGVQALIVVGTEQDAKFYPSAGWDEALDQISSPAAEE